MESLTLPYDEFTVVNSGAKPDEATIETACDLLKTEGWQAAPLVVLNLDGTLHAVQTTAQSCALRRVADDWDFEREFEVPLLVIGYEEAYNLCQKAGMDWDTFLTQPLATQQSLLRESGFERCAEALG
uniref:Uncharacterized protein n=1 Tax=Magnetococcus massalia (strain MO-1) TaxID=451514 RepID=A0A1S7LBZ5_MAGMO|nr:Conserved protein of unknown function [Candidatus Magnetococcus massalia]